ncbi:MAG TPA: fatty acid oxidation complex subunit alpha FadJ [Gemmatimonadaceae bacterium]|nr:fatty acid oxidation complex subunit alpha FadJ [Gemmatimonadaceae bacterium]
MTTTAAPATPYALRLDVQGDVAVLTFDLPNESVNKITRGVRDEFAAVFDRLTKDGSVRGAVLISGKPDIFIAGADIEEFQTFSSAAEVERLSRAGHELLEGLERLRVPVVAAIHGACLGGGLETVLACAYRIATDHPKTVLALPEVQLGLIPGAGGTQRLPKLVGLQSALDMILTGRNVRARKALQIGLVDELVHPAILRDVALRRARELADGTRKRSRGRTGGGVKGFLLDDTGAGRSVVFAQAHKETLRKTRGDYPAPLAAITAVKAGYSPGGAAGYATEARLFGEMAITDVSRQLIFLFFATNALKKDPGTPEPAPEPLPVAKVGILGAGFMGAGIASVAVPAGTLIRMKDADAGRVAKGLAAVREVLKERLTKKQITRQQFDDQMSLVGGTTDYSGFGGVDLVIEAVFEDLTVKHQVLREIERVVPERAIFASNTSTIPIGRIAQASARPDQVIGMHFFSPVHKMPLLEVIRTPRTAADVVTTVVAYGKKLGKTVIVVNDGPGFFANRILSPYINEAGKMLDEGVAIDAIDRALVQFGFPVGPITLVDEVGIDVAGKAGNIIADAFGARLAPAQSLNRVLSSGRYGRKGKKGFYLYDASGKKGGVDESVYQLLPLGRASAQLPAEEIQQRTVLAMLNEAARCLEEDIVRSPRDGDVGAVFGIGFPPFRGGPFRYMDALGADEVVRRLDALNERFPPRYEPAEILRDMARRKARFYTE